MKRLLLVNLIFLTAASMYAIKEGWCGAQAPYTPGVDNTLNAKWTLSDDGVLTISGHGKTLDCHPLSPGVPSFYSFRTQIKSVIFEDGITSIGRFLFFVPELFSDLHKVDASQVPQNPNYAPKIIENYPSMTSMTLSGSMTEIEDYGLSGCSKLHDIELPEGISKIGNHAFSGTAVTQIILPKTVTSLHNEAFVECPIEQMIVLCPTPPTKTAQIGYYKNTETAPKVYVPDTEAYRSWLPVPLPMLKPGEYYLKDQTIEGFDLASNIPGYEATTEYRPESQDPGEYTVTIPVTFKGEKEFSTSVKYSYTIKDLSADIQDILDPETKIIIGNGKVTIASSSAKSVEIYDTTGRQAYRGMEKEITLAPGIYIVRVEGKTYKIVMR